MIIFFSGNVGCGKTFLAKYIARRFNFFYLDADKYKKEVYSEHVDPKIFFEQGKPVPSSVRAKLYKKLESEFKILSKKFKNIIVDETLHSKLGRNRLLSAGKKYFYQSLIILIQSPLKLIKIRSTKKRKNHLLTNTYKMHLSIKKVAQYPSQPNLIVNNINITSSKNQLISFFKNLKRNT